MPVLDRADTVTSTRPRSSRAGQVLMLSGAALLAVGALLPWVEVKGIPLKLDWLGVRVPLNGREVAGTDTPAWPYLVGVAAVVAVLALARRARTLVLALGVLALAAGGALWYYLSNVIEIETSKRSALEQTLAEATIHASVQPGPYVLLIGAVLIVIGALAR